METAKTITLVYLAVISFYSAVICIYDKIAAKKRPRHRIRERTLILSSVFGGAPVMFIVMQTIRHKTKHKKIMVTVSSFAILWSAICLYMIFRFEIVWNWLVNLF